MTLTTLATPTAYAGSPRRGPVARGRALAGRASVATAPRTARALYRLSICRGCATVGDRHQGRRSGPVRRTAELRANLERRHFSRGGVEHLRLHGCRDRVQARAGPLASVAAQPPFQRQGHHSGLYFAALHNSDGPVDVGLEVDVRPDLQRDQLDAVQAGGDP